MTPPVIAGSRVLVAGAGISGLAAAEALVTAGAHVTVTDANPAALADLPAGAVAGDDPDAVPDGTAFVVTSPGRRPDHPLVAAAAKAGAPIVGEPELAWWLGAARPEPPTWLVVTGTNGKTTTVGMLDSILRAAGHDSVACGNIGLPVVTAVAAGHRVLAVELSSFQLHWSPSVVPAAGCVLNVAEDHLDWHGGMPAYAAAKARALVGPVAVAGIDDPRAAVLLAAAPAPRRVGVTLHVPGPGQLGIAAGELVDRAFGDVALADVASVTPGGPPGLTDALAAAALARAHGVTPAAVAAGLAAFRPGGHRGAVVAEHAGIGYVDDSKATNPHAARASFAAQDGHRVVWVVGGLLKGASVDDLVAEVAGQLRGVVVIGVDRSAVLAALARHAPDVPVREVTAGDDGAMTGVMPAAVRAATELAEPGDVVLLAPAAASMDQFRDYAERGNAFADAARAQAGAGIGA
ncbi:UDP-N-acetylmuramoyl-L-alanine--D-glutamate ligase [Pseudonocardia sp. CA-107938]|uniref:UDP-N-acetylmuramoyl-L-alanine--D-glutamate ligase n=1 Tax=Pseudonocardia sp. CA-107938 TaxID=3240021 RepID=UPI003D9323FD